MSIQTINTLSYTHHFVIYSNNNCLQYREDTCILQIKEQEYGEISVSSNNSLSKHTTSNCIKINGIWLTALQNSKTIRRRNPATTGWHIKSKIEKIFVIKPLSYIANFSSSWQKGTIGDNYRKSQYVDPVRKLHSLKFRL